MEFHPGAVPGECRIREGGRPCPLPGSRRSGLCVGHYQRIRRRTGGRSWPAAAHLPRFSWPLAVGPFDRDPAAAAGLCQVVARDWTGARVACPEKAWKHGLCLSHSAEGRRTTHAAPRPGRGRRRARPPIDGASLKLKPVAARVPGVCPLMEGWRECEERAGAWGLCRAHGNFARRHGMLAALGGQRRSRPQRKLEADPSVPLGSCWIREQGVACRRRAGKSRICLEHRALAAGRDALQGLAVLPPAGRRHAPLRGPGHEYLLERRDPVEPGVCLLVEVSLPEGQRYPCSDRATRRGLCHRHYVRLQASYPEELARVALPARGRGPPRHARHGPGSRGWSDSARERP